MRKKSYDDTTLELGLLVDVPNPLPNPLPQNRTPKRGGKGCRNANKTHCPKGHAYSPDNTLFEGNGDGFVHRKCHKCKLERMRRSFLKNRANETEEEKAVRLEKERIATAKHHASHREQINKAAREKWKKIRKTNPELVRKWKSDDYKRRKPQIAAAGRIYVLRKKYGLTLEQYENMLKSQNGQCDICRKEMKNPHIDHNHTTGKVRAILCPGCNMGVGVLEKRSGEWIKSALDYIKRHA